MKKLVVNASVGLVMAALTLSAHAAGPALRLPGNIVGARPAALGGAFTAVADDQNALFYNPAGLARLDSTFAALAEVSLSASLGSGGAASLANDLDKVSSAASDVGGGGNTSAAIDSLVKLGEIVSSRTAAAGLKTSSYWVSRSWGIAATSGLDLGLGIHSKILPEVADLAVLGDIDFRFGYAHRFLEDKLSIGVAPYYKLRAEGGRANFSLAEALDRENALKNIVGIGQGFGADIGLMVTPIEAMSPTFGLAILNLGDTKFYKAASSLFSSVSVFNGAEVIGTPDLLKQVVNVGFSLTPVDGSGFVRVSGELREINRPSAAELKPAFGLEGGFRSKYLRALADAGWGNGSWSAGFELRAFLKLRFATYIEPNLFFDRKENQRVWVLSAGL